MGQSTITMIAGSWYLENSSATHGAASWLYSSWKANNQDPRTWSHGAIICFQIPNSLRYKRITKATIRYYTKAYRGGIETTTDTTDGMRIAPYIIDPQYIDEVTGASLNTYGQLGEFVLVEPFTSYSSTAYPKWRTADITSLYGSNLYNGEYFTCILMGAPGFPYASPYGGDAYSNAARIGGLLSGYEAQLILDYEDVTQLPPTPSYPAGTYVNENTDILFAWAWNSTTPATQASVQLEYKLKTAANYTVVSLTQTTHTYLLSGGLSQGTYQWRIKATNDAGETSAYSEVAEFNVVGKPAAPVINAVPNRTLTEITWNTTDQNAFDITISDANGKEILKDSVASSASSYKPEIFLKGNYTVGVRTRNSTGLVSDWSYKAFGITASGPTKPTIQLLQNDTKVTILTNMTDGITYAVIRTEEETGEEKILGLIQTDNLVDTTFGFDRQYKYIVRAWATGGYTDSDPERICYPKTAIVLETNNDELIIDRSDETFLPYEEDIIGDMAVFNCVGRMLPIAEHGEYESRAFASRVYISEEQKERLAKMARKNYIFYRDYSGRAFPVAIQPPIKYSRFMDDGYMVDITFIRIAEQEVIVNV